MGCSDETCDLSYLLIRHIIDIILAVYFNASLDEVLRAEETITDDMAEVAEGGYLANMAVYHELHCVVCTPLHSLTFGTHHTQRQLRFWLYKDRYYPSLTDAQNAYQVPHLG